ncbi:hypothetical protein B0T19DRAFT_445026 [Cercophora scortea]|uniref:NACHT domain-containing protein n=1 Tax=Cercophora scortea TaxID=314031 RepID=A0AAE0IBJ1_9PEZI|nr:hypothetical protein B0T19DRAFT_445026 [Cercophora scortea]
MSGLEPLVAFSLACGVFQVLSFTGDIYKVYKSLVQTGKPGTTTSLDASSFENMLKVFEDIEKQAGQASRPLTEQDNELLKIATECKNTAVDLKAKIDKLLGPASITGSRLKSAVQAIKIVIKRDQRKQLKVVEETLRQHQNILETRLLFQFCTKSDAIKLQQDDRFNALDSTLRNFILALAEGETEMTKLLTQESTAIKAHVTTEVDKSRDVITDQLRFEAGATRDHISQGLEELKTSTAITAQDEAKHKQLLGSLKYPAMNDRRNQLVHRHDKTFEWIFTGALATKVHTCIPLGIDQDQDSDSDKAPDSDSDSDSIYGQSQCRMIDASVQFQGWLDSPDQPLFWISGKAGSGKSTLMKFLIDDEQTLQHLGHSSTGKAVILSHFLWSAGQPLEASIKGMLCSLLHQLLASDRGLAAVVMHEMPIVSMKESCSDWSVSELEKIALLAFGHSSGPLCMFLDGLDEVSPSDGQRRLLDLLERFQAVPRVKICVSSRPEAILQNRLGKLPMLRVQDLTMQDIKRFSRETLQKGGFGYQGQPYHKFIRRICEMADGVFLWVSLAVKSLLDGSEQGDELELLLQRLEVLPTDLHSLYQNMWERLNGSNAVYRKHASEYLNLVLSSRVLLQSHDRHLTVDDLMLAKNEALPAVPDYSKLEGPGGSGALEKSNSSTDRPWSFCKPGQRVYGCCKTILQPMKSGSFF